MKTKSGSLASLQPYLSDMRARRRSGELRLVTPEGEMELARRAQRGDPKAIKLLVESHLLLVIALVKKRCLTDSPYFADLVQEGNLGLLRAAESFDPDRGVKFSTYASWWVRSAIHAYWRVHIAPTRWTRSLDESSVGLDGDEFTRMDRLVDTAPSAEALIGREEARKRLWRAFHYSRKGTLPAISEDILQERFAGDATLAEIGERHGVTREYVRQVEVKTKNWVAKALQRFFGAKIPDPG